MIKCHSILIEIRSLFDGGRNAYRYPYFADFQLKQTFHAIIVRMVYSKIYKKENENTNILNKRTAKILHA